MNFKKIILLNSILFLVSTFVLAQDKILLLNGKVLLVKSLNIEENLATVSFKNFENNKDKKIKRNTIFSIVSEKGIENIFYKEDSVSFNNDLSVEGMRMYIKGLQEAETFKSPMSTVGGLLIGASSSFLGFYGLIPPAIFISVVGNRAPKMEKQQVSDKELLKNDNFVYGYERKCKARKVNNAAIASLTGFVVGFATLIFLNK